MWLARIGLLGGPGSATAGAAQASTGFSGTAMTLSLLASSMLLIWAVLAGLRMLRVAGQLAGKSPAE